MRAWRAIGVTMGLAVLVPLLARHETKAEAQRSPDSSPARPAADESARPARSETRPPFAGIELDKWSLRDQDIVAPAPLGRTAHLALDPALQVSTERILRDAQPVEAGVVVIDTATSRVKVWANHVDHGPPRDICAEATAPAASIFKIVTASALVETAGFKPDDRQCYAGGESRITAADLVDDPRRDRWCVTLGEALGKSVNTVFARLALKHLKPAELESTAEALGFGKPIPFDVQIAESGVHLPQDSLGFARTAAGFWNTTLSPFEAAAMANAIANRGEMVRPVLVESVTDASGTLYRAPQKVVIRRAVEAETANAVTSMMENTVLHGTSLRAFRDGQGRPFLPNISVAGKTGTLSSSDGKLLYTWFVGFAPSASPEVALAVLVVNGPNFRAKANAVARDVLRGYFAAKGAPGVSRPIQARP
jgi:peptidoglycan glycosyltransferase